jgi:hypothetical protein
MQWVARGKEPSRSRAAMEGNRRRTVVIIMVLRRGETVVNPGAFKKTAKKLTD